MKVDLHNWDTIEELTRHEYKLGHLGIVTRSNCFDGSLIGALYSRSGKEITRSTTDLLLSCAAVDAARSTAREWAAQQMFRLVRDHVRPCV